MNKALSIALLVVGILLIVFGLQASDSIASSFSEFFSGTPTDKSMWLLIGGVVLAIIGLVGITRRVAPA